VNHPVFFKTCSVDISLLKGKPGNSAPKLVWLWWWGMEPQHPDTALKPCVESNGWSFCWPTTNRSFHPNCCLICMYLKTTAWSDFKNIRDWAFQLKTHNFFRVIYLRLLSFPNKNEEYSIFINSTPLTEHLWWRINCCKQIRTAEYEHVAHRTLH
jgi:hypothetical protein